MQRDRDLHLEDVAASVAQLTATEACWTTNAIAEAVGKLDNDHPARDLLSMFMDATRLQVEVGLRVEREDDERSERRATHPGQVAPGTQRVAT